MRPSSIPPHEARRQFDSQHRNISPHTGGRTFSAESRLERWLGRVREIAELPVYGGQYALYIGRRIVFGITAAVVALAVFLTFLPHLRSVVWPAIAWTLLTISVVAVLSVIVNILVAVLFMYIGYRPSDQESDVPAGGPATLQSEVVSFAGRSNMADKPANQWRDALNNLRSAEYALSKLEGCAAFRSFTDQRKNQCYHVMGAVQTLIQELSSETAHQKLAS